jgi:hypothetical protein
MAIRVSGSRPLSARRDGMRMRAVRRGATGMATESMVTSLFPLHVAMSRNRMLSGGAGATRAGMLHGPEASWGSPADRRREAGPLPCRPAVCRGRQERAFPPRFWNLPVGTFRREGRRSLGRIRDRSRAAGCGCPWNAALHDVDGDAN